MCHLVSSLGARLQNTSRDQNANLTQNFPEMSAIRLERDVMEWAKVVLECIYAVLVTIMYIVMEIVELFVPTKSKSLAGQHVLITGAARGLGREICLRLVKEGVKMTCVDVSLEGAEETVAMCNKIRAGCATARFCDITDKKQINQLVADIPDVDVLINNAGIVASSPILDAGDDQIERMVQVNFMAHFWTIRAILPGMISRNRGHVVAIASAASFTAAANIAPYTATKYAVAGMMNCLREEFRHFHPEIKVTCVHPFFISPPPSCVDHWDKTSRLPDVTATHVADKTVWGIKKEKVTVAVPKYLYFLLHLLPLLPSPAAEFWRDMFYAKINPLQSQKLKSI